MYGIRYQSLQSSSYNTVLYIVHLGKRHGIIMRPGRASRKPRSSFRTILHRIIPKKFYSRTVLHKVHTMGPTVSTTKGLYKKRSGHYKKIYLIKPEPGVKAWYSGTSPNHLCEAILKTSMAWLKYLFNIASSRSQAKSRYLVLCSRAGSSEIPLQGQY